MSSRASVIRCGFFLAIIGALGTFSAALIRIRSGFVYPPCFDLFRALFFLQYGVFAALVLSILIYFSPQRRIARAFHAILLFAFYFWLLWILSWGLVHGAYGIELTFAGFLELVLHPQSVAEVGFSALEFISILTGAILIAAALPLLSFRIQSRISKRERRLCCLGLLIAFLLVHVPVRAYCVYQINRNQAAVLAYDDCVAFPLRTELLLPGLRSARFATRDLASPEINARYFKKIKTLAMPMLPRRPNILWLNIESFRADAIDERVMPNLWAHRELFQLRLGRQHWSGGNATQFGIFSMLTGLSGHHLGTFQELGISAPFLRLLAANGYRLSGGKESYFSFNDLRALLPPEMKLPDIPRHGPAREDALTVDRYLQDRESSSGAPTFDFIPFDATHWPYWFLPQQEIFKPASLTKSSQHVLRSRADIEVVRNRYRNACHSIDEQLGRIFAKLEARNAFANTIVIVLGDHGEEFQERGQFTHAAVLNDFQARTALWVHLPDLPPPEISVSETTTHLDLVPTLLHALGFSEDILYTQGRSLFEEPKRREILALCENGFRVPLYRALVTENYISRWGYRPHEYLFSGVQRRDGAPVIGNDWLDEVRAHLQEAAAMYEVLPDVSQPPLSF